MVHAVVATNLEDVAKTRQAALNVIRWFLNRIAHSCQGRQDHYFLRVVFDEDSFHSIPVFKISFDQLEGAAGFGAVASNWAMRARFNEWS